MKQAKAKTQFRAEELGRRKQLRHLYRIRIAVETDPAEKKDLIALRALNAYRLGQLRHGQSTT